MKHVTVHEHTEICLNQKDQNKDNPWNFNEYRFCSANMKHNLFLLNGEYFLLSHRLCLFKFLNHIDMAEKLVNDVLNKNPNKKHLYQVHRGYEITKAFEKKRLRYILDNSFSEVNYVYTNAAGVKYGVITDVSFFDKLNYQEKLKDSYNKTIKYLSEDPELRYLKEEAEELFYSNQFDIDEYSIFKTTDEAITQIRKSIKQL